MSDPTAWSGDLTAEIDGHAGAAALRILPDRLGLPRRLSGALAGVCVCCI
jgi:hypothetical protein